MRWFRREPEPDPVGDLCRLLVERPWEWEPVAVRGPADAPRTAARHLSGVRVVVAVVWTGFPDVWIALSDDQQGLCQPRDNAWRLFNAFHGLMAARAARPRGDLGETAKALAKAVLDPGGADLEAARALADWVMEYVRDGGAA